ncbi:MAG: aminotransferase class IV [Actinomycetota bacterium]
MHVILNGKLLPATEAAVSVFDRAFAYGDALFETLKILDGRPVFFEEHCRRLEQGMEKAGFAGLAEPDQLRRQCLELAGANEVERGRLRLQVSRGAPEPGQAGGFDPAPGLKPTVLVTCEEFPGYPEEQYRDGVECVTVPFNRGVLAPLKSTSMMPAVLARQNMRAAGAGEVILTASDGKLLEGTFTNIFFINGGRLVTPPDDEPILAGVTRGKAIDIAAEMGIQVEFKPLLADELNREATSAFLTSSLLGICPVMSIDGIRLKRDNELTGAMSRRLEELEIEDAKRFSGRDERPL